MELLYWLQWNTENDLRKVRVFVYMLFYVAFNSQGDIVAGSLQVVETSAYCTVNRWSLASNYQLSNMKRPARDSNRRCQRLEVRTLTTTPLRKVKGAKPKTKSFCNRHFCKYKRSYLNSDNRPSFTLFDYYKASAYSSCSKLNKKKTLNFQVFQTFYIRIWCSTNC